LAPYFERRCLRSLDALGIENATDDVIAHTRKVLHAAAADHHHGVLLKVVPLTRDVADDFKAVGQTDLAPPYEAPSSASSGWWCTRGCKRRASAGILLQRRHLVALYRRLARLADQLVVGMDQSIDTWWHELNTWNALESRNFYRRTLGWNFEKVSLPDGEPYWIARKDGRTVGGLYSLTAPRFKGIPSHWMTYMKVDDIEQAEADAREAGGEVTRPITQLPGIGKIALVSDASGAMIGLIEPDDGDLADREPSNLDGETGAESDVMAELSVLEAQITRSVEGHSA
jgi:predicted enzyme related to lactoylglutathione lyase